MDGLLKSFQQLTDVLRSMTPGSRITSVLLLVLVLVSVGYLVSGHVATGDAFLLAGETFSTSQLREMQAALGKAGLEAQLDGARIKVPRGQESKYMAALAEAGALPEDFGGHLKKAVSGSGFGLYGPQQEARMKVAIQSELQAVIAQMKGIERAFVTIEEDRQRGFREQSIVTASVAVQPRANHSLDEATVAAIRSLVAGAKPPLTPDAVTVVDLSSAKLFAGASGLAARGAASGGQGDQDKRLEQDWEEKIGRLLSPIVPGALVTAKVDSSVLQRTAMASGESPSAQPAELSDRLPRRVAISVAVPSTHYDTVWRQQRGMAAGESARPEVAAWSEIETTERRKIEALILPLLGRGDTSSEPHHVSVVTYYPPAVVPLPEAELADVALEWLLRHGAALGMTLLVLVGLLVLRSMVRSVPAAPLDGVDDQDDSSDVALVLSSPVQAASPLENRAHAAGGPVRVREELAEVVRQDPQAALSVLRSWIGNPG
jgi:flagellar M-ring protein FliF